MSLRRRHIWIVMANDFPDQAFSSEEAADTYCMEQNASERTLQQQSTQPRMRIYYRWYKMEVLK